MTKKYEILSRVLLNARVHTIFNLKSGAYYASDIITARVNVA